MKSFFALAAILTFAVVTSFADDKPAPVPDLGVNASLHVRRVFPADDLWNKDISKEAVDANSDVLIASIGLKKPLHPDFGTRYGIPYVVVEGSQAKVPITFEYAGE